MNPAINTRHKKFLILASNKSFLRINLNYFVTTAFCLTLLTILFYFLYKILMKRVNAFGCFDDCFNFMGGYFMTTGKQLYSQIFFNHQPLLAIISFYIQKLLNPINIYDLVLKHRQFLFLFAFLADALLIIRFKKIGLFFALTYELTKYYFFGDRFLAESFVVYLLTYEMGLALLSLKGIKIGLFDLLLSTIFTWFVVFSREPYIFVSLFLYLFLIVKNGTRKEKIICLVLLFLISVFTISRFSITDYLFQVITVNSSTVLAGDVGGKQLFGRGFFLAFFYPVYIILNAKRDLIWMFITEVSIIFLLSSLTLFLFQKKKAFKYILFIFITLFLANLRYAEPWFVFYGTFHILVWYGMYLFTTYLLVNELLLRNKKIGTFFFLVLLLFLFSAVQNKTYFAYENTDPQQVYLTQFGPIQQAGSVIRELSNKNDSLFLDGFDDLIYWEAKRTSDYTYSWYTSIMPAFPLYQNSRLKMFQNNPPQFYYGSCYKEGNPDRRLPISVKNQYVMLTSGGKPTCIYVNKKKLVKITSLQWQKAKEWFYDKPNF